ncbi:MAG: helix-turn-helix domain-containing protein [Pseudomonadota bacterium]|jgi:hypothetical protein
MKNHSRFSEELKECLKEIHYSFLNASKDPAHIILDDVDLRNLLKISKRKAAYMRSQGRIAFSKDQGKVFYTMSDVLDYLKRHRIDVVSSKLSQTLKNKIK